MNINIAHIAFGSMVNNIGAATLGSSESVSSNGRNVNGTYIDEERQLSRNYASLLWEYCSDTDRFMLVHVQGSAVEDQAMARFFSYRDASEVSRPEMLALGFPIAEVIDVMPRMESFTDFKDFALGYTLSKHSNVAGKTALALSQLVFAAIAQGKQLYVGMHTNGRTLRDNGVFEAKEWYALIEAIGMFPTTNLRQQLTFAFCVDENYAQRLADKAVVFYARESKLTPPADCLNVTFEQIEEYVSRPEIQRSIHEDSVLFFALPEASAQQQPLSFADFRSYVAQQRSCRAEVQRKRPIDMTGEEYQMWRNMGHEVRELQINNWQEALQIFALVGGAASPDGQQLRKLYSPLMSSWSTQGLNLEQMKQLVKVGIMEQSWMESQGDQVWAAEYKKCGKSEQEVIACIKRLAGQVPDAAIIGSLASLNPEKDASLIESLLLLANDKKAPSMQGLIIREGLQQMANAHAKKLGINVEKWYNFLSKLSKTQKRVASEQLYMTQLQQCYAKERSKWAVALGTYAKNHTRNSQKFAFLMIEAYMKAGKGEVKLPPRDNFGATTEEDEPIDPNQAEGFIWQFVDELKRDKRSCLLKIAAAIVATALVVGLLCWFLMGRNSSGPQQYATTVAPVVSSQHVMAQLSWLRPGVRQAKVSYDTICQQPVDVTDMKALAELDRRYTFATRSADSTWFCRSQFITFRKEGDQVTGHDTVLVDAEHPFLPQMLNRKERVHQVVFPTANDTICLDIPNSSVYEKSYPDSINADLTSPLYYFWLVAQVEDSLAARNCPVHFAY